MAIVYVAKGRRRGMCGSDFYSQLKNFSYRGKEAKVSVEFIF